MGRYASTGFGVFTGRSWTNSIFDGAVCSVSFRRLCELVQVNFLEETANLHY